MGLYIPNIGILDSLSGLSGDALATKFSKIASERSDCGSFGAAGDLGAFGRGAMQRPFEDASFALKVGEVSGIVDRCDNTQVFCMSDYNFLNLIYPLLLLFIRSDSGLHIILRTG